MSPFAIARLWEALLVLNIRVHAITLFVPGAADDAALFATMLSKDLADVEVPKVRPPEAFPALSSHPGSDQARLEAAVEIEDQAIEDLSLGLKTAVLLSAIHWIMRHCRTAAAEPVLADAGIAAPKPHPAVADASKSPPDPDLASAAARAAEPELADAAAGEEPP
jgi:hypothetical protein